MRGAFERLDPAGVGQLSARDFSRALLHELKPQVTLSQAHVAEILQSLPEAVVENGYGEEYYYGKFLTEIYRRRQLELHKRLRVHAARRGLSAAPPPEAAASTGAFPDNP